MTGRAAALLLGAALLAGGAGSDPPPAPPPGRPPAPESPAAVAARYAAGGVPVTFADTRQVARGGIATFGLPFPRGAVRDVAALRTGTPLQARPLSRWPDGSLRWVRLSMPARVPAGGAHVARVRWGGGAPDPRPAAPVTVTEAEDEVVLATAGGTVRVRRGENRWLVLERDGRRMEGPDQYARVSEGRLAGERPVRASGGRLLMMRAPNVVRVEERGPLLARVLVEGWLVDTEESPVLRYRGRVEVRAGSPDVRLVHAFTHLSPRRLLLLEDYRLRFRYAGGSGAAFGLEGRVLPGAPGARLEQLSATRCTLVSGGEAAEGIRADGWLAFGAANEALVAVRHFWENFPKALTREEDGATVHLWAGPEPFAADRGLRKTHELLLSVGAPDARRAEALAQLREPLLGSAPPDWYCTTRGFGDLAPWSTARFPGYELAVEATADLLARSRPYGMRRFGDDRPAAPVCGSGAADVAYGHFLQFARTGLRRYLEAGLAQARHQGDLLLEHDDGPPRPRGPASLRGLVAATWLTGDPEGLEGARVLGNWLLRVVAEPRSESDERESGPALDALAGLYEATGDPRCRAALRAMVDRLLAGLERTEGFPGREGEQTGSPEGALLSGLLAYHEVSGDSRIPGAVARLVERLHGLAPDSGGRTLEGLARHYRAAGDPATLAAARRAWESTLARGPLDLGGSTIPIARVLPHVEALGLAPPAEWRLPEVPPGAEGRRLHLRAASGTFVVRSAGGAAVGLALLRHAGPSPATVRLRAADGREVARRSLSASAAPLQYLRLEVPPGGPHRLEIESAETRAWDLLTEAPLHLALLVPDGRGLEALAPRAHLAVAPGAREIVVGVTGCGAGLRGVVVLDAGGRARGALERTIPPGDEAPRHWELRVPVPPGAAGQGWALELRGVTVTRLEGLVPEATPRPAP